MNQYLDDGWLFHVGEIDVPMPRTKGPMYIQAKTQRRRNGPAAWNWLDDSQDYSTNGLIAYEYWQPVTLPHDYQICQVPTREANETHGFLPLERAWYRKHFSLSPGDEQMRLTLLFEGVAGLCEVYLNGCLMHRNFSWYTPFEVDISEIAVTDRENVLAVHVDPREAEGWWYPGAGIYRHVILRKRARVSIDLYGVFAHPEKAQDGWRVPVDTALRNDTPIEQTAELTTQLLDENGQLLAKDTLTAKLPAFSVTAVDQTLCAHNPRLWSPEDPALYRVVSELRWQEGETDREETTIGFRTAEFTCDRGLLVNGERVQVKGVCCHQDFGLTGIAVPERIQRYRLERLREMGANAYRTSHYPQHPASLDEMDRLGFLVMDETRRFESTPEAVEQLETLVKRDRNHPCVILWSVGNEEPMHLTEGGRRIAERMKVVIDRLDGTRAVTTAVSYDPLNASVYEAMDVIGVNYNLDAFDALHEKYPDKPILSTECCATGTTRGHYAPDCPERGYIGAYDHHSSAGFRSRELTWKFLTARLWIAGGYQWAGIEHRGETVWPRLCSQSGALDLYLVEKDAFYQNQSCWTEEPMIHLLPCWNLAGREGEEVDVWAYTNCDEAELWQDGRSVGRQRVERYTPARWRVTYQSGAIAAVGYRQGEIVCRDEEVTSGTATALTLRRETPAPRADGKDVVLIRCMCTDADGRIVPDASPFVRFDTNGLGRVVATGSDVCDHVPVDSPDRQMRAGAITALVQTGTTPGLLRVYARADGLRPARLEIEIG